MTGYTLSILLVFATVASASPPTPSGRMPRGGWPTSAAPTTAMPTPPPTPHPTLAPTTSGVCDTTDDINQNCMEGGCQTGEYRDGDCLTCIEGAFQEESPGSCTLCTVLPGNCPTNTHFDANACAHLNRDSCIDGPAPVNLGTAGGFVIIAKSGISTVPQSVITGDIAVSPIAATAMTGFSLSLDKSTTFSTSDQVTGKCYGASYTSPTPSQLTTAVYDMERAHVDAMGRANPNFLELKGGHIGGLTLYPGLYKWTTVILIASDVTLSGGPHDTWIFQTSKGVTMHAGMNVILTGGAQAKNIIWVTAEATTILDGAHFEGILLGYTACHFRTGASINGRVLMQTAVTLQMATITQPPENGVAQ